MRLAHLAFIAVLLGTALGKIFFEESFDDDSWSTRWVVSGYKGATYGRFDTATGKFYGDIRNKGLKTRENNRLYALSTTFPEFTNENSTLVLQYSVKYEQNIAKEDGCGGGFIKLFDCNLNPSNLHGDTPHLLAFGPDICGRGTERIRLDINYKNKMYPVSRNISWLADVHTHVYTLILNPDQTYQILIDGKSVHKGNFENDWSFIPKRIMDPNVTKPWDWDDQPMIYDVSDRKPKDWDQPRYVPDRKATKPVDWDKYMNRNWEPHMIPNPNFKGDWRPRIIHNPRYTGPWIHPQINNPEGFDCSIYKFPRICGIGFELWQGQSGTMFDNILLADNPLVAEERRKSILKGIKTEKEMKKRQDEEMEKIRTRASVKTGRKFAVETPKVFATNDGAERNL